MKHWKKILCMLLGIAIMFTYAEPARAVTNESIREKEDQIRKAKEEVSNLKSNLTDVEALKKELEKSKNDLTAYVTQLDGELSSIQEKIEQYNTLITEKEAQIVETTEELNEAVRQQEDQYEAMKKRIRFMYEKGDTFYLEMLFSAAGFADMMNKADYIEALSRYDRNKLEEYVQIREMVELYKEELETEKVYLDEARAAVKVEEANISSLIAQKEAQITSVSSDKIGRASCRERV